MKMKMKINNQDEVVIKVTFKSVLWCDDDKDRKRCELCSFNAGRTFDGACLDSPCLPIERDDNKYVYFKVYKFE